MITIIYSVGSDAYNYHLKTPIYVSSKGIEGKELKSKLIEIITGGGECYFNYENMDCYEVAEKGRLDFDFMELDKIKHIDT